VWANPAVDAQVVMERVAIAAPKLGTFNKTGTGMMPEAVLLIKLLHRIV
jgi:hypothetical protein